MNRYLKLFGRINYFPSIPTCVKNISERHRRTDRQTNRRRTVASRMVKGRKLREQSIEGINDTVCLAADRHVSVFPASERGESNNNRKRESRDQLYVHGLQRRFATDAGHDDRPHLRACHQSPGSTTNDHYTYIYQRLKLLTKINNFTLNSAVQASA